MVPGRSVGKGESFQQIVLKEMDIHIKTKKKKRKTKLCAFHSKHKNAKWITAL